jgi:hypothetical protein
MIYTAVDSKGEVFHAKYNRTKITAALISTNEDGHRYAAFGSWSFVYITGRILKRREGFTDMEEVEVTKMYNRDAPSELRNLPDEDA